MNLLQAMLTGTFACLTLAIMSGFVYMIAKARCDRQAVPTVASARRPDSYMEVWECPHCHRLSRIARQCKWCMKDMPPRPRLLTVPEKEYTGQLLLPGPAVRRNPAADESSL
jgi:hypothetical protein